MKTLSLIFLILIGFNLRSYAADDNCPKIFINLENKLWKVVESKKGDFYRISRELSVTSSKILNGKSVTEGSPLESYKNDMLLRQKFRAEDKSEVIVVAMGDGNDIGYSKKIKGKKSFSCSESLRKMNVF